MSKKTKVLYLMAGIVLGILLTIGVFYENDLLVMTRVHAPSGATYWDNKEYILLDRLDVCMADIDTLQFYYDRLQDDYDNLLETQDD